MTRRSFNQTKTFRRNYAKALRSGRKIEKLNEVMEMLIDGAPLPIKYNDHPLRGQCQNVRDCHIEGDWILLYEVGVDDAGNETILFHATDNHENLFG